jgi:uncharacterized protein YndB with AHSA1/START domain
MRLIALGLIGAVGLGLAARTRADSRPTSSFPAPATAPPQVTEAIVNAPLAKVWDVFSTAAGFKKLGVAQCEMDFRIGGLIRTHYDPRGVLGDEATIENEILAYEPQRMLAFRIHKPPLGFPFPQAWKDTWTVVTLSDLGDGRTHVRLAGLGYGNSEESQKMRQFFETGNAWVMQHLQQQFDPHAPPAAGPAHADDPLAPIRHERVIELPRAEVWRLLTTADGWRRLFQADARIELHPGGRFEILFDQTAPQGQQGSEGCAVLSFIPDEMLSFTWNAPPKFAQARQRRTWVVVRLDELAPTRTRVRLDHQGFARQAAESPDDRAEWEGVRAYFQRAWEKVLDALQKQGPPTS